MLALIAHCLGQADCEKELSQSSNTEIRKLIMSLLSLGISQKELFLRLPPICQRDFITILARALPIPAVREALGDTNFTDFVIDLVTDMEISVEGVGLDVVQQTAKSDPAVSAVAITVIDAIDSIICAVDADISRDKLDKVRCSFILPLCLDSFKWSG